MKGIEARILMKSALRNGSQKKGPKKKISRDPAGQKKNKEHLQWRNQCPFIGKRGALAEILTYNGNGLQVKDWE